MTQKPISTQRGRDVGRTMMLAGIVGLFSPTLSAQMQSVVDSSHNLSASGPGAIRATSEQEVCIFCHTPHNASPIRPLWNRVMPTSAYSVYTSRSLDAKPGQPTGSSKMCLSCHDGTIALGSVVSRDQIIQMASGITTLPPGASNLGTDLSDDHPISFRYDNALWMKDRRLADPHALPSAIKLDPNQEMQCTACHNAHNNVYGNFMVMSNLDSTLCKSCHRISTTTIPTHINCVTCHQTHAAPSGPYLLNRDKVSATCLACHDGSRPDAWNIAGDLRKVSIHDAVSPIDLTDQISGHSTCADCHEPHSMMAGTGTRPPRIQPVLGQVKGLSSAGSDLAFSQHEYEVCFKCHADKNVASSSYISRQITQINTRLEFDPSAVSFHPVEISGKNPNVPSLRPGLTTASMMYCSDCHNSDTGAKAGGTGPDGVHGSNERPLLIARYQTIDFTPESATAYALCYRCHERDTTGGILRNASFPYHSLHVVNARTPCSVCHDPHGISSAQGTLRNNSNLINFDVTVVQPDQITGVRRFEDMGLFRGSCTLSCHGVNHLKTSY